MSNMFSSTKAGSAGLYLPVLAMCLLAPVASRAESGTVDLLLSGVATLSSAKIGDTIVTARGSNGTVTTIKSSGDGPFVEGASATVQCATFSKKSSATFELEGYCAATFSAQDSISLLFKRKTGDVVEGSSGDGVQQFANGTGRFAGITGECKYGVNNLAANWNVTLSKCRWNR
jgi:hypothetical protein